jgi:hypothetical protein
MKAALVVIAALLAAPGALDAQDAAYRSELQGGGAYEGGRVTEPLVVITGAPSSGFFYRGDSIERSLALSGVHLLREAPDDGVTPLALLAFAARVPSVRADLSLASRSDDSTGTSTGQGISLTSRLSGDRTARSAAALGETFLGRATAVRAGISGTWTRETGTTMQLESPSGRGDLANQSARTSAGRVTLGASRRLGPGGSGLEAELAVDAAYGWRNFRRDDEILFTEGGFRHFTYELGSTTRAIAVAARALVLDRRLFVEGRASYSAASGALTQDDRRKIDRSRALVRAFTGTATWFARRTIGLTASATYGTETDAAGLVSEQRTGVVKSLVLAAGARVFVTPRASASATYTRTERTSITPPDGATFQRLEETDDRIEAAFAVRF